MNMTEQEYKKFLWASRRGMLELDVVLIPFLEHNKDAFVVSDLEQYERFLQQPDPDLYAWIMGYEEVAEEFADIVRSIQQFVNKQL